MRYIYLFFLLLLSISLEADYYVVKSKGLNIRTSNNIEGKVIATVHRGDTLDVSQFHEDWSKIKLNGEVGYVSSKYILKLDFLITETKFDVTIDRGKPSVIDVLKRYRPLFIWMLLSFFLLLISIFLLIRRKRTLSLPIINEKDTFFIEKSKLHVSSVKLKVLMKNRDSETIVNSTGGGGMVYNGIGYISPPRINSYTNVRSELHVLDVNNSEHLLVFNQDLSAKKGDDIELVFIKDETLNKKYRIIFLNLNIERYWFTYDLYDLIEVYYLKHEWLGTIILLLNISIHMLIFCALIISWLMGWVLLASFAQVQLLILLVLAFFTITTIISYRRVKKRFIKKYSKIALSVLNRFV